MLDPTQISVFWVPGCTSCALIKSYLDKRNISYDSFNIKEDPRFLKTLFDHGITSVPVVFYQDRYVLGEILSDVIDFLGLDYICDKEISNLACVQNIMNVLDDMLVRAADLTESQQYHKFPGLLDRTTLDHLFHITIIVNQGLIESLIRQRSELQFKHYKQRMYKNWKLKDLQQWIHSTQAELSKITDEKLSEISTADTFFGKVSPSDLIKRTNEHVCQHYLQFYYILKYFELDDTMPKQIILPEVVQEMHDISKHTIFDIKSCESAQLYQ